MESCVNSIFNTNRIEVDLIENFTWKYTSLDREAILVRPPSMTLRSHLTRGGRSSACLGPGLP